jgi:hypothetical protein
MDLSLMKTLLSLAPHRRLVMVLLLLGTFSSLAGCEPTDVKPEVVPPEQVHINHQFPKPVTPVETLPEEDLPSIEPKPRKAQTF